MFNKGYEKLPTSQPTSSCHREKPGLFSFLLFSRMTEIFELGNARPLQKSDFLPVNEENKARVVTEKLQHLWNDERKARLSCGKSPRLWGSVVKFIPSRKVITLVSIGAVGAICRILQPLLLGFLVSNLIFKNSDTGLLYACAALMGVVAMGKGLAVNSGSYITDVLGARLSCALKGIIYSKVTLVGHQTLQEFQQGHVVDLLSNDVQRIELALRWLNDIVPSIYFIPIVIYLFLKIFHLAALAGMLFLMALVPYFVFVSYLVGQLRRQTASVTDRRIAVTNELLSGIRAVKTNAWEDHYRERVKELRRKEISIICEKSFLTSTVEALLATTAPIATFLSVLAVVLAGIHVTPIDAFMLLSFMNLFKANITLYLGFGLQALFEAFVSLRRIEEFLLLEDLPLSSFASGLSEQNTELYSQDHGSALIKKKPDLNEDENGHRTRMNDDSKTNDQENIMTSNDTEEALVVSNLIYKTKDEKYVLNGISFVAPQRSMTVICGQVGSGKSTLLSSIAGEVNLSRGTVKCPKSIAYVPQVAWVFSGTIRENILFDESYDHEWYLTVIDACALKEDIDRFPDGDETIVGERGVVLSGGQKARVSLARAVYSSAAVYLLDDPLSAVDQKVGQHVFNNCICGLLSEKIRVLVSHFQRHLAEADQVIVLDSGCTLEKGTPLELELSNDTRGMLPSIFVGEDKVGRLPRNDPRYLQVDGEPHIDRFQGGKPKGLEIPDEDRIIGKVSFQLYWNYFKSGWHPVLLVALAALFAVTQPVVVSPDVCLSLLSNKILEQQQKLSNLIIYASLTGGALLLTVIRVFLFILASLSSSQRLHDKMVAASLHAQLSFFDTNPTGRILNRFSRDVGSMDEQLPERFINCIQNMLFAFSAVLIPAVANVWLLFVLLPTLVVFVLFVRYYLKTSRELKRLESICRSPVFSHLSESMTGLDTIRTRGMEEQFIEQFYRHQDVHNQAFYMIIESTRWFGVRVDLLCVPFIICVAVASVFLSVDAALAGLSLAYVIETVEGTQYAVRQFSEVENLMTSVERVQSYTKLESEPGYNLKTLPPMNWPSDGHLTFHNVSLTYYEGGPQVLKKLNFEIRGKSKIGVAGRTGAGKSSLVAAILRMPDAQGDVIIDGVKISDINLQESRRCISVLGQVPVLFSGSLRRNLDPLNHHKDLDLWTALQDVQLKSLVENLNGQLEYELLERGANLSVGERQLVCLARTLLQSNKIVILDEPTAHVDPITERTIWSTVNEKLKDCTVIIIAHRLDTIKDCDMILVLSDGEVVEYDAFDSLVCMEGGVLAGIMQITQE